MDASHDACDVLVTCHGDLNGWGGAVMAGRNFAAAAMQAGLAVEVRGFGRAAAAPLHEGIRQFNLTLPREPVLWRIDAWRTPGRLAAALHELAPPRQAVMSFCPFWTVAARRAWPDVPVYMHFCGLLSNCEPFTRPPGVRYSIWEHLSVRGIAAVERAALRRATAWLVPSEAHADELIAFEPAVAGRVIPVGEGCRTFRVDPGQRALARSERGLADRDFLILAIGSCDRRKAFDAAVANWGDTPPETKLAILGDGPERAALQRQVETGRLARRVWLPGWQRDLSGWFSAADAVLSTSWYDPFPNVLREALSGGLPVLCPRHDPPRVYAGLAPLIARGDAGLLFDRTQPADLARQVTRLVHDASLRDRLAANAARMAPLFHWQTHLRLLAGLADPASPHATRAQHVAV